MIEILKSFNETGLSALNGLAQYSIIKDIAITFADAPIFILPIFLLSFWIIHNKKGETSKKENMLYIVYSVIMAISINLILQKLVHIERPEAFLHNAGHFLLNHIPDASFPSDHAAVSSSFLTALFLLGYRKSAFIILPFFIIMLLSRVIAGVHWPLDIIGGIIIGIISGFTIFKFKDFFIFKKINKCIIKIASFIKL